MGSWNNGISHQIRSSAARRSAGTLCGASNGAHLRPRPPADTPPKEASILTQEEAEHAIGRLRAAYASFSEGDIDATVKLLDSKANWSVLAECSSEASPNRQYLTQARAAAAELISEPEGYLSVGDWIVVLVNARVRTKDSLEWQQAELADVYRFRDGHVVQMRAFANREEALSWVGID